MSDLQRAIALPQATAMVVGTIIGASIFVQPSVITSQVPSIPGVLLIWLLSGALTLIGALVAAELASIFTESGGVYVYLRESVHPSLGFLWGWAMFWTMHSGILAVIAVIFARYTGFFVPLGDAGTKAVAIGVILVLSAVNYVGVRQGAQLQTAFTAGKLIAVGVIILLGFTLGFRVPEHFVGTAEGAATLSLGTVLTAMVAGLFAFGGWHMVTYAAEETVEPTRTIPRALIIGTLIVTAAYVAMNAVYLFVLPLEQVGASERVAADFADALLGFGGGAGMSAIVMFSTFGALAGIVLAGPRVYHAMASDGLLFGWVREVHPRYRTPHRAIVLQAVWASFLVATGTYLELFRRVVFTEWGFFGLMAIGLVVLRRRGRPRGYSMPGFPVLPLVFAATSFAILVNELVSNTRESLEGLALVLIGVPVYVVWARSSRRNSNSASVS